MVYPFGMLKPVPVRRAWLPCFPLVLWACSGEPGPSNAPPDVASGGGSGTAANAGAGAGFGGGSGTTGGAGQGGSAVAGGGGSGGAGGSAAGRAGTSGAAGGASGTAGTGGLGAASGTGGTAGAGALAGASGTGGAAPGGLPPLHVDGNAIKDPSGKTIVLRGFDLPDLGTLYANAGQNTSGITARIDTALAAGLVGRVVRLAVYPRTTFNGSFPFYSPVPYPVGQTAPSGMHAELSEDDYVTKLLMPAVEYARQKGMYAIIDYHQIDDATGQSGDDAVTFWQSIAPRFASDDHVIFEPFNEPIDTTVAWSTFKPTVQRFIDTIRAAAPDNLIVVPSTSWDQHPGDAASSPPSGSNLVYAAHVYPGNWASGFQQQVATAVALVPVFFTEWGYVLNGSDKNLGTSDTNWGPDFQTLVDANGASWSAWVADGSWTPNLFTNQMLSSLSPFGTFTASWLADKASSD